VLDRQLRAEAVVILKALDEAGAETAPADPDAA
jgi:hypothetical protein